MSVCLSVPCRIPTLLHGPGCNFGNDGCAAFGGFAIGARVFRCDDNIAPIAKCQRVLVCALWLVKVVVDSSGVYEESASWICPTPAPPGECLDHEDFPPQFVHELQPYPGKLATIAAREIGFHSVPLGF